jgi:acetylglutamate kinase
VIVVVKIGGAAIDDPVILKKCAQSIAELAQDGHRVAVVHGGGKVLTRMLEQLGKISEFVDGLRVTDSETRDAALMVLAGVVNKKLVAAIQGAGMKKICSRPRPGVRRRDLFRRSLLDRGFVAAGWDPGNRIAGAGRGRRILQRKCR